MSAMHGQCLLQDSRPCCTIAYTENDLTVILVLYLISFFPLSEGNKTEPCSPSLSHRESLPNSWLLQHCKISSQNIVCTSFLVFLGLWGFFGWFFGEGGLFFVFWFFLVEVYLWMGLFSFWISFKTWSLSLHPHVRNASDVETLSANHKDGTSFPSCQEARVKVQLSGGGQGCLCILLLWEPAFVKNLHKQPSGALAAGAHFQPKAFSKKLLHFVCG